MYVIIKKYAGSMQFDANMQKYKKKNLINSRIYILRNIKIFELL